MVDTSAIREHMEVIGADGVHIGTVDRLEGNRIKLTKKDSGEGSHAGHHHGDCTAVHHDRARSSAVAPVGRDGHVLQAANKDAIRAVEGRR